MSANGSLMTSPNSKYIVEGNDIYLQFDFDNMDIETDKIVLRGDVVVDSQSWEDMKWRRMQPLMVWSGRN